MSTPAIPAGTWHLDPSHTTVGFTVRHVMVSKVRGRFGTFSGVIHTSDDVLESTVEATVEMISVDTGDANRDQHLRTSDFFDVETFPTMTFRSTALAASGDNYELAGDLTIRGVTKPVTFELEVGGIGKDPYGATRLGLEATTNISRKDFGLDYNAALEAGGVLIGDKVTLELDVEAVLQAANMPDQPADT